MRGGKWSPAATFLVAARASGSRFGDGEVGGAMLEGLAARGLVFRPSRPEEGDAGAGEKNFTWIRFK